MNKRPVFASVLFGFLSAAGIVALFSQTDPSDGTLKAQGSRSRWISLNPSGRSSPDLDDVLPQVIEEGARALPAPTAVKDSGEENARPRKNILRLR